MPWLVRFKAPAGVDTPPAGVDTPPAGTDTSAVSGLFEEKAMLISQLWDLGTTGVVERETDLVAGFARLDAAQQALQLAGRHDMLAEVESVDDSWVRHDPVQVTISTEAGAVAIPIVAGAAFGHGGHPTTRLCLDLMGRALARQKSQIDDELCRPRVLDLGTGSGVLAIAAERLGARSVTASDVDPAAIDSARFNVVANGVDADLVHGDTDTVTGRAEDHGVRFDLIVANVLIGTHEQVSWSAVQLLRPDGCLVIAGFLADQTERAISAYRSGRPSLQVVERVDIDGWCGLSLAVPPEAG